LTNKKNTYFSLKAFLMKEKQLKFFLQEKSNQEFFSKKNFFQISSAFPTEKTK